MEVLEALMQDLKFFRCKIRKTHLKGLYRLIFLMYEFEVTISQFMRSCYLFFRFLI